MSTINNNLSRLHNFTMLSKNTARGLLHYAAASSASFRNDDSWITPLKINLLSPANSHFPISSSSLKAHEKCFFDRNSGLKISIMRGEKEVLIAFGAMGSGDTEVPSDQSEELSAKQWQTALLNLFGATCDIYEKAELFVREFSKLEPFRDKKIVIIGQSLGGSLAQYAGLKNQLITYCFNPIPLGRAQIQKLNASKITQEDKVFVISAEGDYATKIAEHTAFKIAQYVIQTPKLYGKKFTIPSAYSSQDETHTYFMGSLMKYLGYDIKTRLDFIFTHELCIANDEVHLREAIDELGGILEHLTDLNKFLTENELEKSSEKLNFIKENNPNIFNYLSFIVWLANEGRDFGDAHYGEHRLLETPSILSKIKVNGTPLLDSLIEHFNILFFIQNAKKSFIGLSDKSKQISQEFLALPFISETKKELERQLHTFSKSGEHLDGKSIDLLKALHDECLSQNGSLQKQKELISEIWQKYPKLYFAILLLIKNQLNNRELDFSKISSLLNVKPTLLIEIFKGKNKGLIQLIECMGCLQAMQTAVDNLAKLKTIFQDHLQFFPDLERRVKGTLAPVGYEELLQKVEELEVFFSLTNDVRRQLKGFQERLKDLPVSSKNGIKPDRLIEKISEENGNPLKQIFMVCAECTSVVKVGGLGEAARGIADGLKSRGHQVTLIMPKYDVFPNDDRAGSVMKSLELSPYTVEHTYGDVKKVDRVFSGKIKDLDLLFIEDTPIDGQNTPDRFSLKGGDLYTVPGDIDEVKMKERFAYFGQAAAELIRELRQQIDIVFFHDWHGALGIPLLAREYTREWIDGSIPPLVYVFHNNGYFAQGMLDDKKHQSILRDVRLPLHYFNTTEQSVSIADHVCTVSEGYALEVQEREGKELQSSMRRAAHKGVFSGITNGCNLTNWNPETAEQLINWIDPMTGEHTPINFGEGNDILESKKRVKEQLQNWLHHYHPEIVETYGLDVRRDNVILFVGRFDSSQKGIDKFRLAMRVAAEKGATFIAMGSKEDPSATQLLDELEKEAIALKNPNKWGGAWIIRGLPFQQGSEDGIPGIGYLVRAAANLNFCPSEYEPCGLTHLEGFPFGQLTVATNLGGYADIICEKKEDPLFNGFLFPRFDDWKSDQQDQAIQATIRSAIDFSNQLDPAQKNALFLQLIQTSKQYSWTTSPSGLSPVEKYEKVMLAAENRSKIRGASEPLHPTLFSEHIKNI